MSKISQTENGERKGGGKLMVLDGLALNDDGKEFPLAQDVVKGAQQK